MVKAQQGLCAICGRPPKNMRLHVDHDHREGVVRGLLCPHCNWSVGWLENVGSAAQRYLTNPPAPAILEKLDLATAASRGGGSQKKAVAGTKGDK